ncbi:MAG: hypothetical protein CM15mP51_25220 [Porticoccaceae bacterium]|nr:MAG: hypothetical protein CM15mP51_25220 [Porticoccaceae bacterium]
MHQAIAVLTLSTPGSYGSLGVNKDIIIDTKAPVITISDNDVLHEQATTYTDPGASATDNIDGNITSSIITVNNVSSDTAGFIR